MKPALLAFATLAFAATSATSNAASIVKRIPGPDGPWDYVSVDPASNRLFVARGDGVQTVDIATGAVTAKFVPGQRVHAAFIMPGTGMGLSTNGNTNTATLFDATTGAVKATIPTGQKPDAAVYDEAARLAYVMNGKDGSITVIDPATMKATATIPVGGALEFAAVDGRGHVFVNIEDKSELAMVDIASRKVTRRTKLAGCEEPSGLALTKQGTLIAACANGVAKVVDAATGRVMSDIAIGIHPDATLYDAARDRAYIPAGQDGTLTVIDTSAATPRKIDTVATARGARTGAVDPKTGNIYLPTVRYDPNDKAERPKSVPGSFEVLVVSQ